MLTDDQKTRLRHHAGYPVFGNQYELTVRFYDGYDVLQNNRRLEFALNNLTASEENMVVNEWLPQLDTLKDDIFQTRENADTAVAAVWTRNKSEVAERRGTYNQMRKDFCTFLNVPYGVMLAHSNTRVRG